MDMKKSYENLAHCIPSASQYKKFEEINNMGDEAWEEKYVKCNDCVTF